MKQKNNQLTEYQQKENEHFNFKKIFSIQNELKKAADENKKLIKC
jgi:hypothetical protein